jgi:hypothetical protein
VPVSICSINSDITCIICELLAILRWIAGPVCPGSKVRLLLPVFYFLRLTSSRVIILSVNDPLKPLRESLVIAIQKLDEFVSARADIDKQRAAIDSQIIFWKQLVDSLRTVCPDEDEDPSDVEVSAFVEGAAGKQTVKFTDGVRMVLRQNRSAILTAPEIRNGLLNLGFNFSKYRQPLTPIHNCLKRLEEQGEVMPNKDKDGQIVGYTWISSIERALAEETTIFAANSYAALLAQFVPDAKRIAEMHEGVLATQQAAVEAAAEAAKQAMALNVEVTQQYTKKSKKG